MLSLTNPWILIGVLALVISSYFYGHHEAYVEQEAEIARLNVIERQKESEMQQLVSKQSSQLKKAQENAKTEIAKLQSNIASGGLRLSVRTIPASQDSCATSGNTEARAELDPETSQSLVAIADDGDSAIRQLNACIDLYNEVRSKQ